MESTQEKTSRSNGSHRLDRSTFSSLIITAVVGAVIFAFSYDAYWFPQDDGVFAYIADVLVNGGVYGVDIYDIHAGYQSLLSAALFHIFGADVVVLRYPLVVLGILQALMVTYMVRRHGVLISSLAGLLTITLGFMNFTTGAPNWYALFFAITTIFILTELRVSFASLFSLGLVIGLCFMFRHPSAVFLLFGVVTYLLLQEQKDPDRTTKPTTALLVRGMYVVIVSVITWYSSVVFEPFAFVLFAVPALVLSLYMFKDPVGDVRKLATQMLPLGTGFTLAVLPMVIYQLSISNFEQWLHLTFLSGTTITSFPAFFAHTYVEGALYMVTFSWEHGFYGAMLFFLLFWAVVLMSILSVFVYWVRRLVTEKTLMNVPPAVIIITFFGLVSFYYQIFFYLFISFSIFVCAILLGLKKQATLGRTALLSALVVLNLGAILISPVTGLLTGDVVESEIPRVSLRVFSQANEDYLQYLHIIEEHTTKEDHIYVFPINPDLYFISERRPPVPFYGSTFQIHSESAYQELLNMLTANPPRLYAYNVDDDAFVNEYDLRLLEHIRSDERYREMEQVGNQIFFVPAEEIEKTAE